MSKSYATCIWPRYNRSRLAEDVPWVILHDDPAMLETHILAAQWRVFVEKHGPDLDDSWEEKYLDYMSDQGYELPWIASAYEIPITVEEVRRYTHVE